MVKRGRANCVFVAPSVALPAVRFQPGMRCHWQPLSPRVLWPSLSATPADQTGACPGSTAACTEQEASAQNSDSSRSREGSVSSQVEREEALFMSMMHKNKYLVRRQWYEYTWWVGFEQLWRRARGNRIDLSWYSYMLAMIRRDSLLVGYCVGELIKGI